MTAESFIEVTPNKDGITADLLVRLPEEVNQQEGGVTLFEVEPQEVLDTVSPNNLNHLFKVLEDIEGEGGVVDSDLAKEFKKEVQFALDITTLCMEIQGIFLRLPSLTTLQKPTRCPQ